MTYSSIFKVHCPTHIEFGLQAWKRVADIILGKKWSKVLLLTDPGLKGTSIHLSLLESLKNQGIELEEFDGIDPEPKDINVESALRLSHALSPDVLVVLGGGSAIDVAKAVAIVSTNGGKISDYEGTDKFEVPPLPLIAIPTTAGTGSEVSGAAVITDTLRNKKMAIRHAHYGPTTYAVLDPAAISTTPQHVAIHSGIDAFVHAFESYLSKLANPFTDAQNLHAIRLITDNIRPYVANRENHEAAFNMLCASSMAAMSFGTTGTGNVHCMAMALGSKYPIPHGLANAVCLTHVAEFNFIANPERFATLAATMGIDTRGLSVLAAGRKAIIAIKELCDDLNIPHRLRDVGVKEQDLPNISEHCFLLDYNRWNPRWTTKEDFLKLLQKAY